MVYKRGTTPSHPPTLSPSRTVTTSSKPEGKRESMGQADERKGPCSESRSIRRLRSRSERYARPRGPFREPAGFLACFRASLGRPSRPRRVALTPGPLPGPRSKGISRQAVMTKHAPGESEPHWWHYRSTGEARLPGVSLSDSLCLDSKPQSETVATRPVPASRGQPRETSPQGQLQRAPTTRSCPANTTSPPMPMPQIAALAVRERSQHNIPSGELLPVALENLQSINET